MKIDWSLTNAQKIKTHSHSFILPQIHIKIDDEEWKKKNKKKWTKCYISVILLYIRVN